MTKFEFEDRTGLKVTDEEYYEIESMYMAVPNMEKDEFCKRWRQCGNNPLAKELAKQANVLNGMLEERNNEVDDCHDKMNELAEFLIGKASAHEDTDLYREAVKIIGQKAVTLCKIRMNLPLWEEDVKYINDNLK